MIIGIIGNGFVGKATKILKSNDIELLVYDICPEKCEPLGLTLPDLSKCDLIFVAVPTPMNKDGSCYLGIVESVVNDLKEVIDSEKTHIVIRSTVPPGTSDRLNCYFMPEFLTEKNWEYDFENCRQWIFGLLNQQTDISFSEKITKLFEISHKNQCIKYCYIEFVKNKEAEMIKYFRNTYLAVKVSFCNEIASLCDKLDVEYENVRKLATLDERIGQSHSQVPGHDGLKGYGGTCFPKDTNSLLNIFNSNFVPSYVLKGAVERNETVDRPQKDWTEDKGRAVV